MWKLRGYIAYAGVYPISAKYLIYDQYNEELIWVDDSNNAEIFSSVGYIKEVLSRFPEINMNDINFRTVIMTDEPYNK